MKQTIRIALISYLLFFATARASLEQINEVKLHLGTKLFDQVVTGFQNSLSGLQNIPLPDSTVSSPLPVKISGIQLDVQYNFSAPRRLSIQPRVWELDTNTISAQLHIANVLATQQVQETIDGIDITVILNAECHNLQFDLNPAGTFIHSEVQAEIIANKIQLTLPSFDSNWKNGAWTLSHMECTGVQGFESLVANQALSTLNNSDNFDTAIHDSILTQLISWGEMATNGLFQQRELATNRLDFLASFNPDGAIDGASGDVFAHGTLHLIYPYVNPGEATENYFGLDKNNENIVGNTTDSYLFLPVGIVQELITGEYLTSKLNYNVPSSNFSAFTSFMHSPIEQLFFWPDLLSFSSEANFQIHFLPLSVPNLTQLTNSSAANSLSANIESPLLIQTFAPIDGKYLPYVKFLTDLKANLALRLITNGIHLSIVADAMKLSSSFDAGYVELHGPIQYIANSTIGGQLKKALVNQGIDLPLPAIAIGNRLELRPSSWSVRGGNLLIFVQGLVN